MKTVQTPEFVGLWTDKICRLVNNHLEAANQRDKVTEKEEWGRVWKRETERVSVEAYLYFTTKLYLPRTGQ